MDYKKEYEDMVRRCKELHESWNELTKKQMEIVCPQLAESEDERIRKFLVKHVSEWIGCIEHDLKISSKDIESEEELAIFKAGLAYLEKQKDEAQKQFNLGVQAGREEVMYEMEKEQEHEGWPKLSNCIKDCKKCKGKCFYRKEMYQEQESVSVDDKLYVEDILSLLNFGCSTHSRNEIDMWIKSLPERLNPQQKQEWSEEDEKMFNSLCTVLNGGLSIIPTEKFIYWLKSLRPLKNVYDGPWVSFTEKKDAAEEYVIQTARYPVKESEYIADLEDAFISGVEWKEKKSWKPSKEQIEAVYNILHPDDPYYDDLKSLYEQLKKL